MSETSLKSYTSCVSSERKHEMSTALLDVIVPQRQENASSETLTTSHVRINAVLSEVNCNGIIDMSTEELEALITPIETDDGKEIVPLNMKMSSNTTTTSINQLNCGLAPQKL